MKDTQTKKFGLFTTIAMITGIVVGSGIFFKADDVLLALNGNVVLGCLCFLIGAIGIVFGGLTVRTYAMNDIGGVGGIVTYCEMAFGKTWGYLSGWFQSVLYLPAICAIVTWVGACYTCVLFNWPGPFSTGEFSLISWVLTIVYLVFFYALNTFQTKGAGKFQDISTIMKLGALGIVAICGLLFGDPARITNTSLAGVSTGGGFFAALIAMSFSYDGWMVAPSIAHEIKDPEKNLPIALCISPLLIMGIYVLYFLGIVLIIGPEQILVLQDSAVGLAAQILFGPFGDKLIYVFILISIFGTVNGLVLGYIRLPYALALRKEIPMYEKLAKVDERYDIPLYSTFFTFVMTLVMLFLHFLSTSGVQAGLTIFNGLAIDSLPIVTTYVFYCSLFLGVIKKYFKKEITNVFDGLVFPSLALVGGGLVLYGGITTPGFNVYLIISLLAIAFGLVIRPKK